MMKTAFVCPFNLERLTGTPIRTRTSIKAAAEFLEVSVVATNTTEFDKRVKFISVGDKNIFSFSLRAIKELKKLKPNVVHGVSTLSVVSLVFYKYFINHNSKIIFEMHGWSWYETKGSMNYIKRFLFFLLDVLGFTVSNRVIAMSFVQMDFLRKKIYKKEGVDVIWGPVDFKVNFKWNDDRTVFKVGYLGNNSFWQGIEYLIGSAQMLKSQKDIQFNLAGFDALDQGRFPKKENVVYVGRVERKNVASFIQDMDVMVSPRIKSNVSDLQYPQKLSEYLACGRPVIVSKTNDQEKIVKESRCGIVVDLLTGTTLKGAIEEMKAKHSNERMILGKNAADFAEREFSFEVFTKRMMSIYSFSK